MSFMEQPVVELEQLPITAYELIDHLERAYRPRCIQAGETPEMAHRYAGMVELVQHLVHLKEVDQLPEDYDETED